LRREFNSWTNDTIFGAEGSQVINISYERPTYGIGLAMCICVTGSMFLNFVGIPIIGALGSLGGLVCWIIYWVQLAQFKNKVQRRYY